MTFEEDELAALQIARRIREVGSASLPWLVAEQGAQVVGYAYAGKWNARAGYRFSAEITVYLEPGHARRGIGSALYGELFPLLEAQGIRAVIAGIALPNEGSVALHEKFGFTKVAHFRAIGFKFSQWIDVGYWQRTL